MRTYTHPNDPEDFNYKEVFSRHVISNTLEVLITHIYLNKPYSLIPAEEQKQLKDDILFPKIKRLTELMALLTYIAYCKKHLTFSKILR